MDNANPRNLVLTGLMGTGKSTVARTVAGRLGRRCVDMDEVLTQRAGMSIAAIFQRQGEAAFREQERALCAELALQKGLVIATGGGTLLDMCNRESLGRNGCLVCLDCQVGELAQRLQGQTDRPLLQGADPAHRLHELWQVRRPAYAGIPHHLDTTGKSIEQVTSEALTLYASDPRVWWVREGQQSSQEGAYQVQLVPGGLNQPLLGPLLRVREVASRVAIVSNAHVWPLYGAALLDALRCSGYMPEAIVLPAGEDHKTLESVRGLYDRFIEMGLDRSGAVLALGGGVITDMAGFAAATFMRGVPFVPLPTTLLGIVDASVGGKVAVDHPRGKNLIGVFVRPLLVMLDPDVLHTLPEVEFRSGLAEIIKAGVIADPELFAFLEKYPFERPFALSELRWLVERALAVKIAVVQDDPYEQGRRAVLNLGHTFAHALEVLANYQMSHGQAVSIGMAAAAHLAELSGLCSRQVRERLLATLERYQLPTQCAAHPPERIYQAMQSDKKRRSGGLRFILPHAIGEVRIIAGVPETEVLQALERICP